MYRKAAVIVVAKTMRRPVILHLHAGPGDLTAFFEGLGALRRRLLRAACSRADRVLSVSASSAETLRRLLIDTEIIVVPNAPPPVAVVRPRKDGDRVTVLYLGGFENPVKGGAVLMQALPELLARCPQARVALCGPGEGPAELPSGAEWRGWLDEAAKERAFDEAGLFVLPSLSEGLPVALLEAMSRELAVVATRVGGVPEVVSDGLDAVLVEPGQASALAEALAELVESQERRRGLARAARERVERLAADDVYSRLDRIYAELTS